MLRHLACLLALALASPASADALDSRAIRTAEALRDKALGGSDAYALVESLTTEVGPRMAGSAADARAVAWAEAKLNALGFERVWREPVSFPVWQRGHERAEVVSPFPQPLLLTLLGGSVGTDGQPLQAEVVAFASLDALRAVDDGSLDGRIAFIDNRMQRARDGSGYGPAVAARSQGASIAARKGASALLIRSIGTSHDRFPHTGNLRYAEDAPRIPAAALSNPDADLLANMLRRGQPVAVQLDLAAGTTGVYTSYNVIGEIRGREMPDEVVLLGAHLDSWDHGTGAIDDGAGIGITFAAGALIGELHRKPRRSIRVVAFANEEQGLYGARAYAAQYARAVDQHRIAVESDFGAGRIYALRAGVDDASWPLIERIGAVLAPLGIATERGVGGPGPDIGPLVEANVPWAQLAQDGSDYFDYHHTANDTLDKIDAKALDQQVAAYAAFAYLAADSKAPFKPAAKIE
ncbi:MAG TPA: M28 family peptidase [Arenimonas sp.]|nr:M28 family peptidase [Arenimonas sp.]